MASPYLGRSWLIKAFIGGQWVAVMGLQSTGVSINNTIVDTTSTRSGGWREILADCGNQALTITGAGVVKNAQAEQYIQNWAFDHTLNQIGAFQVEDGSSFYGSFMVSKLEYTGAYDGAKMYNMTLESSGTINPEYPL